MIQLTIHNHLLALCEELYTPVHNLEVIVTRARVCPRGGSVAVPAEYERSIKCIQVAPKEQADE